MEAHAPQHEPSEVFWIWNLVLRMLVAWGSLVPCCEPEDIFQLSLSYLHKRSLQGRKFLQLLVSPHPSWPNVPARNSPIAKSLSEFYVGRQDPFCQSCLWTSPGTSNTAFFPSSESITFAMGCIPEHSPTWCSRCTNLRTAVTMDLGRSHRHPLFCPAGPNQNLKCGRCA